MNVLLNDMLAYMAPFWSSARMRRLLALISCQPKTKYNILEEKVVAQRPLWTYKMCYTLFFSRKILTSFSHLILGRQKPPLGVFFVLSAKETPNAACIGVLFNRFWAQQFVCWVCPKFAAKCWGKDLQNGNEERVRVNTETLLCRVNYK